MDEGAGSEVAVLPARLHGDALGQGQGDPDAGGHGQAPAHAGDENPPGEHHAWPILEPGPTVSDLPDMGGVGQAGRQAGHQRGQVSEIAQGRRPGQGGDAGRPQRERRRIS